jgi:hypothetical protein
MAKSDVISGADLRNVDDTGIESHVILVSTDISFYALSYSRSLTWRKIADINYGIMTLLTGGRGPQVRLIPGAKKGMRFGGSILEN